MMDKQAPALSITVSLADIYSQLCPNCREAFLALLSSKAGGDTLQDALRSSFECQLSSRSALPPEPSPHPQD